MGKVKNKRNRKCRDTLQEALDSLALALVAHKHKWTNQQRKGYEQATKARATL
jgi:hypothetical protein